ncbi:MAG: hypothetical protein ACHQZR_03225 [Candidatus Limnocylindrales bacterium]
MAETHDVASDHEPTRAALLAADGAGGDGPGHDEGSNAPGGHDAHDEGDPLGPLDARAWGAGILGVATGGLVAFLLYLVSYH